MTIGDVEIDRSLLNGRGGLWNRMKRPLHAQSRITEIKYSNGWMDKTDRIGEKGGEGENFELKENQRDREI